MITLENDRLVVRFPEVHAEARLEIGFQRTLRIPDDGATYPLPPDLGRFPLRHVDDHEQRVPSSWLARGGVLLPMYQSEALWLNFRTSGYPMLVKVAAGRINAVTGEPWSETVSPAPAQNYLVAPDQPWLDGYCVEKGVIRQFVAMPLGAGYTPEEQLTGEAKFGGVQLLVYPLRAEAWERRKRARTMRNVEYSFDLEDAGPSVSACYDVPDMGLAMGGRMKQEIYEDSLRFNDWDLTTRSRCYVHLANSLVWRSITGSEPPATPATAEEYTRRGLPWFDWYAERPAVGGGAPFSNVKSIVEKAKQKNDAPLPENTRVTPTNVKKLGASRPKNLVREGSF